MELTIDTFSATLAPYLFRDVIKLDTNSLVRRFGFTATIEETICIFVRPNCRDDLVSTWQSCLR